MKKTSSEHIYWLIFKDGNEFSKKFLKKGYGHIDILTHDEFNWLYFSPRNNRFEWEILSYEIDTSTTKIIPSDFESIVCIHTHLKRDENGDFEHAKRPNLSFLHPLNCVGIAKYVLGVWPVLFTPYQFFNWIINNIEELMEQGIQVDYIENKRGEAL